MSGCGQSELEAAEPESTTTLESALQGNVLRDFGLIAAKELQYSHQSVTREPSGKLNVAVSTFDSAAEDGDPRVVFVSGTPSGVFQTSVIAPTTGLTHHVIDTGGRPHVVIAELTRYDEDDEPLNEPGLLYATHDGSQWQVETITTDQVRVAKVFVSADGTVRVLFARDSSIFVATRGQLGWTEEATGLPSDGTLIALDAARAQTGDLHVAYILRSAGVEHLYYGLRRCNGWEASELRAGGLAQPSLGVISLAVRPGGSGDSAVVLDAVGRNPPLIRRGNGTVETLPLVGSSALGTFRAQVFFESNGALQVVTGFGLNGLHHARYRQGVWTLTRLMGSEAGAGGFAPLPVGVLSAHTVHIVAASVNFDTRGGVLRYLSFTP